MTASRTSEDSLFRVWDDDLVVFDARSGETHWLKAPIATLVTLLNDAPGMPDLERSHLCATQLGLTPDAADEMLLLLTELGVLTPR